MSSYKTLPGLLETPFWTDDLQREDPFPLCPTHRVSFSVLLHPSLLHREKGEHQKKLGPDQHLPFS